MDSTASEKLKEFFATAKPSYYKKGDIVLRIGDGQRGAFFLKSGYIKDASTTFDGRDFTLFIFQPNDIFSYSSIFNKIPNEHSFRALTDCVIYEKSREGFLLFLEQNPDVQLMITQNIVIRLRGLMQRIENLAFGTAFQRVGSMYSILAERFGKKTEKGITIPIYLTQHDIAELIGLSRETTSIEIKKLMDKNIVTRSSGFYVVRKPKLLAKITHLLN